MHALLFLGGLLVAPALSVPTPVDMRSEGFFKGVMNLVFPPDNADAPPPPESDAKRFFFLPAGGDGSSQAFTLPSDSESYIKRIVNSGSIPEYMVQGLDLAHWQSPPDAPPEGTIIGYLIAVPSGDSKESTEEVFRKEKSKKGVPIISYYAYGDEEDNGQTRKIHKKSFPYYRSSEQRDKDLWACSKRIGKCRPFDIFNSCWQDCMPRKESLGVNDCAGYCGDTCGCNKHQNDLAEIYRRDGGQDDTMVRSSSNFHRTGDSSSSNSENSHEAHRSENNKDEKTHKVTKEQDASGDSRANERNSDNRHSDSNENNSDGHSDRSSQASTEERRKSSDYQDGDTRKTKEETSRVSGSNSEDNSSNKVNKSQRESNNRVDEVKSQNVRAGED